MNAFYETIEMVEERSAVSFVAMLEIANSIIEHHHYSLAFLPRF